MNCYLRPPGYKLVIIDEAHLCGKQKLKSYWKWIPTWNVPIVCSSATPKRHQTRFATAVFKFTKLPHVTRALGMPQVSVRITRHPFPKLHHTEYIGLLLVGIPGNDGAAIMKQANIS